jgi:hypothetical protein
MIPIAAAILKVAALFLLTVFGLALTHGLWVSAAGCFCKALHQG